MHQHTHVYMLHELPHQAKLESQEQELQRAYDLVDALKVRLKCVSEFHENDARDLHRQIEILSNDTTPLEHLSEASSFTSDLHLDIEVCCRPTPTHLPHPVAPTRPNMRGGLLSPHVLELLSSRVHALEYPAQVPAHLRERVGTKP